MDLDEFGTRRSWTWANLNVSEFGRGRVLTWFHLVDLRLKHVSGVGRVRESGSDVCLQIPDSRAKQTDVVYKINCLGCLWCCIVETERCFESLETRKKKHTRNVKFHATCSNVTNY